MEEEPEGVVEKRELTTRILREQDMNWERNRTRELGREAIMGPTTSPRKISNEVEEGTEIEVKRSRRKRRKLKHDVLQEGWGEHPIEEGAAWSVWSPRGGADTPFYANLRGLRCPTNVLMMIVAVERGLPSPTVGLEARVRMRLEKVVGQITRDVGNKTMISGAEIKDAGCNNSERIRISSEEEELS